MGLRIWLILRQATTVLIPLSGSHDQPLRHLSVLHPGLPATLCAFVDPVCLGGALSVSLTAAIFVQSLYALPVNYHALERSISGQQSSFDPSHKTEALRVNTFATVELSIRADPW
ncbi:hypothetical protein ACMFMG_010008 [Clarireedia jacksonii]